MEVVTDIDLPETNGKAQDYRPRGVRSFFAGIILWRRVDTGIDVLLISYKDLYTEQYSYRFPGGIERSGRFTEAVDMFVRRLARDTCFRETGLWVENISDLVPVHTSFVPDQDDPEARHLKRIFMANMDGVIRKKEFTQSPEVRGARFFPLNEATEHLIQGLYTEKETPKFHHDALLHAIVNHFALMDREAAEIAVKMQGRL